MLPPDQFQASQWESGAGEPAPEHLQDVVGVLAPISYPHFLSVLLSAAVPAVSSLGLRFLPCYCSCAQTTLLALASAEI